MKIWILWKEYFKLIAYYMLYYSERLKEVVIARSEATWQSHEIASLRSQ
jgi:hypothetical protein